MQEETQAAVGTQVSTAVSRRTLSGHGASMWPGLAPLGIAAVPPVPAQAVGEPHRLRPGERH